MQQKLRNHYKRIRITKSSIQFKIYGEREIDMKLLYGTKSILEQKDFLSMEDISGQQLSDLLKEKKSK